MVLGFCSAEANISPVYNRGEGGIGTMVQRDGLMEDFILHTHLGDVLTAGAEAFVDPHRKL